MKLDPEGGTTKGRGRRGAVRRDATDLERVPVDSTSRNESDPLAAPEIAARLEAWFPPAARDLPWRRRRTPYRVLVSETMLQQTQVARVAERFPRFVARFPSVRSLASSPIDEVLQEWEGLGYYRRARLLHAAARVIVERHGGRVPSEAEALRSLPGVGPYTAGAVASLAFGRTAAIVDGNVARVLIRLSGRALATDDAEAVRWCWDRSRSLVEAAADPAVLNESLMELGATVCTPRSPSCERCPLASACSARRRGAADRIPLPKSRPTRTRVVHHVLLLPPRRRRQGLSAPVRQRPETGLWASMWEFPAIESARRLQTRTIARRLGLPAAALRRLEAFKHATTHRDVEFVVLELDPAVEGSREPDPASLGPLSFHPIEHLGELAMSVPQRRIAESYAARFRLVRRAAED
jgi:A/G-specific adenine glycosylase